jgi:hypothetical protein
MRRFCKARRMMECRLKLDNGESRQRPTRLTTDCTYAFGLIAMRVHRRGGEWSEPSRI